MIARCGVSMEKLLCKGTYEPKKPDPSAPVTFGFAGKSTGPLGAIKEAMHKVGL